METNEARVVIWTAGGESAETDVYCSEACEQEALSGFDVLERERPTPTDLLAAGYGCAHCRAVLRAPLISLRPVSVDDAEAFHHPCCACSASPVSYAYRAAGVEHYACAVCGATMLAERWAEVAPCAS